MSELGDKRRLSIIININWKDFLVDFYRNNCSELGNVFWLYPLNDKIDHPDLQRQPHLKNFF